MTISSPILKSFAALACLMLAGQQRPGPQPQPEALPGALGKVAAPAPPQPVIEEQAAQGLTPQQLDDLLAPIALYPDPLIAQILPAATYPLEVVQAARWVREHPDLQGLDDQDWDPSVRAVAHYPTVIKMLDEKLDWTIRLGQAFLNKQQDVMDSIQQLRIKARTAGALRDTPQQQVIVEQEVIRIVPAQPDVIYVPEYNPQVVYVEPAPGFVATSYISFSVGFVLGWWLDLDCDWHHHHVYYHYWRPHRFDGDPFPHGPGYQRVRSGELVHSGRDGEAWRRDPHRERPPVIRPRGSLPAAPSDAARGRITPARPSVPSFARPGGTPDQARPTPRPGPTPAPAPGAKSGQRPSARPGPAAPSGPAAHPTQPAQPARPTPNAIGGYQRGTQAQQHSQRGQSSRGIAPPSPAQRPTVTPRPAPRAPSPAQPVQRPRPAPGALGGYQSGHDAKTSSQRGNSSRHGRGP